MLQFFPFEGFNITYDEHKVRAERAENRGFIEFSMNDLEFILEGRLVDFPEIDRLYEFIKDNHDIMKAHLKGEWVEVEEPDEANRLE